MTDQLTNSLAIIDETFNELEAEIDQLKAENDRLNDMYQTEVGRRYALEAKVRRLTEKAARLDRLVSLYRQRRRPRVAKPLGVTE